MSDTLVSQDQKCFFNNVPIEIHLMIWEACMPPARTIRLGFPEDPEEILIDESIPKNVYDLAPSQLPVLLHINRSSRAFALTHFVLGFGHTPSHLDKTYWNPKIDTLYIPPFNPKEEASAFHFAYYGVADPLERTINLKFWQGWLRSFRFRMLASDKIQHLALCFPDNSLNEMVGDDDEDLYIEHGILCPRAGPSLCPTMGELNWGIDKRIALCRNLKTLTWVGDASMFSGASKWGTPSIRGMGSEAKVDKKLLRQGRAIDFLTGHQEVLVLNSQFLKSFETYIEATRINSRTMREWKMPRLAVGNLVFEKERVVNDFCVKPVMREERDEGTEEEDDYNSDYFSDDSIE